MSAGVWRCEGTVTVDASDPGAKTNVAVDTLALRHVPECVVQCFDADKAVEFTHVVRAPPSIIIDRTEVVVRNVYEHTVAALVVEGRTIAGIRVAYCCYYVSASSIASVRGLQSTVAESSASGRIEVGLRTTPEAPRVDLVHAILHGSAASGAEAIAHVSRLFRSDVPLPTSIVRARTTHALRWAALWNGDLIVGERSDASVEDQGTLKTFNIHVRTSVYALYAASRDPNAIVSRWCDALRPITSRGEDFEGDPDMLTVPALLSVAPWLAWAQPPTHRASAWTPVHVIARAVVDAWNGYRATLDRPRLELLFQTLRLDMAEMDLHIDMEGGPGSVTSVGAARTLRGEDVDDDAYTIGVVRRAFAAAEQISNTLRIPPDPQWTVKRDALASSLAADQTSSALVQTPIGNRDALVLLHPASMDVYAGTTDLGPIAPVMEDNRPALLEIASAPVDQLIPELAFAAISALASDARRLASFDEACARADLSFEMFIERASESVHPVWGAATSDRARLAASIVACTTFGFLGMRFQGHVTRDGYHTVPAKLLPAPAVTILPECWYVARHSVTRSSGDRTERLVQNSRASTDATDTAAGQP
jgi:hypothetical protein